MYWGRKRLWDTIYELSARVYPEKAEELVETVKALEDALIPCCEQRGVAPVSRRDKVLFRCWLDDNLHQSTSGLSDTTVSARDQTWIRWQFWLLLLSDGENGLHGMCLEELVHRGLFPMIPSAQGPRQALPGDPSIDTIRNLLQNGARHFLDCR